MALLLKLVTVPQIYVTNFDTIIEYTSYFCILSFLYYGHLTYL